MYQISKTFRFEAAHRLANQYSGKCAHLHGHSWSVEVFLKSQALDALGFVKDFGDLKPIREWIDQFLDHGTLVSETDPELLHFLQTHEQKHYVVHGNPTCETLAKSLFDQFTALGFDLDAVRISETCTSSATFTSN